MSEPSPKSHSAVVWGAIVLCFLLLVGVVRIPTFLRTGRGKTSGIVWRLRLIDGAKQQWAIEHHQTNDVLLTAEDLAPYLRRLFPEGMVRPEAGERYRINTLWKAPEAELTRELEGRPKGTVFRLDEIILPSQRIGVDAGNPLLFAFGCLCPGTTHRECWAK